MKSNAAGQLLGYSLQFPRALLHLLDCSSGDSVCIEVLGDVGTIKSDGSVISEEDKSSIVGNPLTNKSTDLWKTFSNWVQAAKDDELIITNTRFVLYCNKSGRSGIVDRFSEALSSDAAKSALEFAKNTLSDIDDKHDIWKYFDFSANENEDLLLQIIERFELDIVEGDIYDEIRDAIINKHIPHTQVEFFLECMNGWLVKYVQGKIASKEYAVISWKEFNHQFNTYFDRSRKRELIDFTLQDLPGSSDIDGHIKTRPKYIQQLDVIKLNEDEIVRAVSDYLRADINRSQWIESEIIDENVAKDFEDKLCTFWRNQKKRIALTEPSLPDTDKGQLLLSDCLSKLEVIRDMSPPDSTVSGTYHALADEPVLGWHPEWENLISKDNGE